MQLVCIDASVGVKWFNQHEIHTKKALEIRKRYAKRLIDLIVPELFFYEVANALRYCPDFDEVDVKKAVRDLFNMQMITLTSDMFLETAAEIAKKYGITIYDASYIALSKEIGCNLFTGDEKLSSKLDLDWVRHLKDFR